MCHSKLALLCSLIIPMALFVGCSTDDGTAPDLDGGANSNTVTFTTSSSEYLNNRFFKLDAPIDEPNGRNFGDRIILGSIKVFRFVGGGAAIPGDINNIAVYVDSTGFNDWDAQDFTRPEYPGFLWRPVSFDVGVSIDGEFKWIDIRQSATYYDFLAVTYSVINVAGETTIIGDDPATTDPSQFIPGFGSSPYYRMKLLKASNFRSSKHVFKYVLRNIYSMGSDDINPIGLKLEVEALNAATDYPELSESEIPYFQIFGLDTRDTNGADGCDGLVDFRDSEMFNLADGWFQFPNTIPEPFNGTRQQYEQHCGLSLQDWGESFLSIKLAPELYDPLTFTSNYELYSNFKIVISYQPYENDKFGKP